MGLRTSLLVLERHFAWGVFAVFSGSLLGIAGLYYALHDKRPVVTVRIVSQFDILDVRQPLSDLAILFQGQDIQRSNLNLRTLHVRFTNEGEADLLQSQYDQLTPWGLLLHGGRILKVQLLDASSPYIQTNLAPQLRSDSFVELNKLILEPGRHFTLDLLILHPKTNQPELTVIGKVVGADSIPVRLEPAAGARPSIWSRAFSGSLSAQAIRVAAYFIIGVVLGVAVIGSGTAISSAATKHTRRRRAKEIRLVLDTTSAEEVVARDILVRIHSVAGAEGLLATKSLIEDKKFLTTRPMGNPTYFINGSAAHLPRAIILGKSDDPQSPGFASDLNERLTEGRLLQRKEDTSQIHPAFHKLLSVAIERLVS